MRGLVVNTAQIARITTTAVPEGGSKATTSVRVVTAEVLARTKTASCKCEDLGLVPGLPVADLIELGAGCTAGNWVCERLDTVRRAYGK